MRRLVRWALVLVLVAVWSVTLRPATLGGPASLVVVSGNSMLPHLTPGTLVVGHRRRTYAVGEVIIYRVPAGEPGAGTRVIHRVTGGSAGEGYRTRGDNRRAADLWRPRPPAIEGAKVLAIPGAGRALTLLASPTVIAGLLGLLVFVSFDGRVILPRRRRRATRPGPVVAMWPPVALPAGPVLSGPPVGPAQHAPAEVPAPAVPSEVPRTPAPAPRHAAARHRRRAPTPGRLVAAGAFAGGVLGAGVLASRAARSR